MKLSRWDTFSLQQLCLHFTQPTFQTCHPCQDGKYNNGTGNTVCYFPSAGWKANLNGSGQTRCPAGQYADRTDQKRTACNPCPAGEYVNSTGNSSCTACPDGEYNPPYFQLIKFDDILIGATHPRSLAYPAAYYKELENKNVSWFKKGKF